MKFDAVIIGGGSSGCSAASRLASEGKRVCLVTEGLTLDSLEMEKPYQRLAALTAQGVAVLRGDSVAATCMERGRAAAVRTRNGVVLEADSFYLATGRFFSRGLVADMDGIYEPLFGADVDFPADRSLWFNPDFFAPQPFESFGVKTSEDGRIYVGGKLVENVFAIGKILGINAGK